MVGDAETQPTDNVTLSSLAEEMGSTEFVDEADDGVDVGEADESEESEEPEQEEPEEGEPEEAEEEAEEESTVTLKHDGKEVTLKQSEVIELAQKGFDYTNKTMAVAEERKAVQAEREQAEQFRQQNEHAVQRNLAALQAFEQFTASQIGEPPPIEWAQQDAAYYLAQKEQYEARKGQLQQAREAIQHLQGEAHRQRQAWIAQQADATESALRDTLPGWNDDTLTELADYAGKLGLNPQTVDVAFVQKGFWEALHKARAYDAIQAQKANLKPKTTLAKVQKPTAGNQPNRAAIRRADAEKRYQAAPSLNSLAALIE